MSVAVVGGGAMGGLWASRLWAAGLDTVVVDVAATLVDTIRRDGLVLESAGETLLTRPRVTVDPAEIGQVDTVIVSVKAHQTRSAAELALPLVGPTTTVVSLQNGWGNADTLAEVIPEDQILAGVTYHSATVRSPGRVSHTGNGPTAVGPLVDGANLAASRRFAQLLTAAGIATTPTPAVKTEIWKKLIVNSGILPVSALSRLTAGELGRPGPLRDLVDAIASETIRVALQMGYDIDHSERLAQIHTVLRGAGTGKASMLQDVEAQRQTEIDVINGAVVRAAEQHNIDAPLNKTMVALVKGLESSWR